MKTNYCIDYQGLSLGEHHFSFDILNDIFAPWPEGGIENGEGKIEIGLLRHANFMELDVTIIGSVELECDRCTDIYRQPINFSGHVVVKLSSAPSAREASTKDVGQDDLDDIIWLDPAAAHLDLSQWLYESIILSLPVARVHAKREDCNKEVIKYINSEL
ncbi:MAG: DUF177 domain-containing protein [Mucinivorans sp.]